MNSRVEEILKKHITTINSFLDENGHNRFTECVEALEQAQRDAVGGFARWCDIDQEAIYNHPHFMQDYADQYLNQTKEDIKEKQ